jgi:hypothetical protein
VSEFDTLSVESKVPYKSKAMTVLLFGGISEQRKIDEPIL